MSTKGGLFQQLKDSWLSIGGRRQEEEPQPATERRTVDRRREPRVTLHRVGAVIPSIVLRWGGQTYALHNLAARGFAVRLETPAALAASVNERLEVELCVGETAVPMTVRLVSRQLDLVGFEILAADLVWQVMVAELLDPLLLGKQLREIDQRFVTPDRKGNRVRWFQGGPACDLFLWFDPTGSFFAAQLFFMGQVVEWSTQHGVRTGTVSPEVRQERNYAQSELFNLRKPPDAETLHVARRIVAAADLPDDVRALLAG